MYAVSCAMLEWLAQSHSDYEKDMLGIPELEDLTIEKHKAIFKSIAEKDAAGAAKQISDHIMRINRSYHESRSEYKEQSGSE